MDDRWSWVDDLADHHERVAKNIVLPAGWAADKALFCAYSLGDAKASAWWCRQLAAKLREQDRDAQYAIDSATKLRNE